MTKLFAYFQSLQGTLQDREEGQTLVEYALILSLVSIGALAALGGLSTAINGVLDAVSAAI